MHRQSVARLHIRLEYSVLCLRPLKEDDKYLRINASGNVPQYRSMLNLLKDLIEGLLTCLQTLIVQVSKF